MDDKAAKTTLGVKENLEALLCYVFGWLSGAIFLVLEKENSFVRFHAMQSLATFLSLFILSVIAGFIPFIGWILAILIAPISIFLWVLLMYKAYKGERYKLPLIGEWAEEQIGNPPVE
jgi:uncharacterized membrane protein